MIVFGSADPATFISHVDVAQIKEYRDEAAKMTGDRLMEESIVENNRAASVFIRTKHSY